MDEKTKEALEIVYHLTRHILEPYDQEALAHLQAMAEENAALKAEVERLGESDNIIYQGIKEWKARAEKAEADRDVFKHNLGMEIMRASNYAEEFRKVEADRNYWEREQANENRRWRQAEADLARYRRYDKLIEAVEKLSDLDLISDDWPTVELRSAALSCLESPESDTVSRGKDDILGERKGKPVICPENGPAQGPEPTRRQR